MDKMSLDVLYKRAIRYTSWGIIAAGICAGTGIADIIYSLIKYFVQADMKLWLFVFCLVCYLVTVYNGIQIRKMVIEIRQKWNKLYRDYYYEIPGQKY